MASKRLRIGGIILVFILTLLALERLCSANAHASETETGQKNCDEIGYGRKGLAGNGCRSLQKKLVASNAEETEAFVRATKEVYQLMRRDYGNHGRPRRKPPINNHEPTH